MNAIAGFIYLSLFVGGSYSFTSRALNYFESSILISLRMAFGTLGASVIFILMVSNSKNYVSSIKESFNNEKFPLWHALLHGIMHFGIPHTLISLSQKTLPSTIVLLAQPLSSLFSMVFANYLIPGCQITPKRVISQAITIGGIMISIIPALSSSSILDSFDPKSVFLVFIAVASVGFSSVFFKLYLSSVDTCLCSVFQLTGATVYSVVFSIIRIGPHEYFQFIINVDKKLFIYPFLLGVFCTCSSALITSIIVREYGPIISGFLYHSQIVVGSVIGVTLFDEWMRYGVVEYIESILGLLLLLIAAIIGIVSELYPVKPTDMETLIP